MKNLVLTLTICMSLGVISLAQNEYAHLNPEVDSIFSNWLSPGTPGLTVAVVKHGKVVLQKSYGLANLEYNIPITSSTVFHAASLAKQFTAYAVLTLEQDGLLSLDDDVRKYIPEVPDFGKVITLRHLATHTSGLKDQWRLLELAGWRLDDVITTKHILHLVENQKSLNFDPGEQVRYSNTGFTLLAEVVARVSGKSFADYTQERIFQPLKMANSQFYDDHNKIVKNRAYAYQRKGENYEKTRLNFSTVGATSLFTTAEDMCKWANHLNNSPATVQNIVKQMNTLATLNDGSTTDAGLGQWGGDKYKGGRQYTGGLEFFDHTGSDGGYRLYFGRFPGINSAVVLLANTPELSAMNLSHRTVNLFIKEHFTPKPPQKEGAKSKEEEETEKAPSPNFIKLTAKQLAQYEGQYFEVDEWYKRNIVVQNDTLVYMHSEDEPIKLAPISNNEFKMLDVAGDIRLTFSENEKGEQAMEIKLVGTDYAIRFVGYSTLNQKALEGIYFSPELGSTYHLKDKEGSLYLENHRSGKIQLSPINENLLTSNNRNFKFIEVVRNEQGKISGLNISNSGARNLLFEKRE